MPKKQSKADFLRSWSLPYPSFQWHHLRYKTPPEKGVYWYWFSLWVRERDVKEWGTCISCGKPIAVDTADCGHFVAASGCGRDLLFDPMNCHAECGRCNAFDENHLHGYERGLVTRYGADLPAQLKARFYEYRDSKTPVKDWKGSEYAVKIKELPNYPHFTILNVEHE